jgi:aspartyl-tRNA(Asn)/glutamyl-tRNA(Gln) amidotransferase subunit B
MKTYHIQGETKLWEVVIGLEVHAQVNSKSKLFSGAQVGFGAEANSYVSLVDAGMPGMLPVINELCVTQAVRTGLGIKAQVQLTSIFDRKNYFYADLPTGYQISQFSDPIIQGGEIEIDLADGSSRIINVTRLHLEQDAGKSLHEYSDDHTFIDLNRAGVALMEIVSEPEMRTPEEAGAYFKKLRSILMYLDTCDGDMEKGNMRCDVNVSVRPVGETELGTRCEMKNVNSVRFLMRAIEFESHRQVEILEAGGSIQQQTRLFDSEKMETRAMRSKENAHDYRYFPDPDLLPLKISAKLVEDIKATMPELPDAKKARYMADYGLSRYDAGVLTADRQAAIYYETLAKKHDAKLAANWMAGELFGRLNKLDKSIVDSPVSAEDFSELLGLMEDNTISGKIAKTVLDDMVETGESANKIVDEKGLKQVTDTGAIAALIDEVIANNADKVAQYKAGKEKLFGFFVGQVMKVSGGKANPGAVNALLKEKLGA